MRTAGDGERILVFSFHRAKDEGGAGPCEIEVRLIPHAQNVIARDGGSSVSELKPKDLRPATPQAERPESRSWERIEEEWRALVTPPSPGASSGEGPRESATERDWNKALAKKEKILERLEAEIAEKSSSQYADLGEWLKAHATLEVPPQWRELTSPEKGLAWNIEESFRRAKENARKLTGTRARYEAVQEELCRLRAGGPAGGQKSPQARSQNLLARGEARGRSLKVAEDLEAYIGKSAADNLRLLRQAQPFDYWMHLRERPGSHAILRRTRSRVVTDAEFLKVGVWVAEQSLKKRASELKGERYDLLIVECRYVRPIKGDKLGRVHYTHDRVLTIRF